MDGQLSKADTLDAQLASAGTDLQPSQHMSPATHASLAGTPYKVIPTAGLMFSIKHASIIVQLYQHSDET